MTLTRVGILALAVYGASWCGAIVASNAPGQTPLQRRTDTADAPHPRRDDGRPAIGFALNLHYGDRVEPHLRAIDELAQLGVDSVEVLAPAFQQDGASEQIEIEARPRRSPRREHLVALLQHARRRGLATTLMPVVLFSRPRGNEWRGKISPENWDKWWHSYDRMIDYFLELAVETDVQVFSVGSELLTTERQSERWRKLIRRVRSRFDGQLMYSANWDHYHVPTFWQDLDLIGVSGYWDLTTLAGRATPTDAQLERRWRQIKQQLLAFAVEQDRPLVLTEVGYPSLPWGLKDPWNYVNSNKAPSDGDTQARGYRAFLAAWSEDLAAPGAIGGVFFYEWDPYRQGDKNDTGYGIRGKPTHQILQQWLAERER